ncbi:hypothetical protein [Rhizobium sp. CCGE 510]|uniref:hypothetical protein n=1 Tax=Rhizobium sp. CCGE 510 TaxID=1132836 RepID=UPI00027B89EC|nr:hypothetical protein [Rhizobium sp. CCGE 510]EJT06636.1 putative transmembrane protein [Rhizobium sp. CCGE 510]
MSIFRSGVVHVLVAFMAMGSWAVFANRAYAMPSPLYAGLVQGTISSCLTLFLKTVIDWLSTRFSSGSVRFWAPPLTACVGSASILVAIHAVTGTPEILKTIAFRLLVSTSYAAIYNYSLLATRVSTPEEK